MRAVRAQFNPPYRPSRRAVIALLALAVATIASIGDAAWQRQREDAQVRELAALEDESRRPLPKPASPPPPYQLSAEQMLRERAAPWASMLRTLESGARIGVTPTRVDFNAADGIAHVELEYTDTADLFDYLERINEGAPSGMIGGRWRLIQTHAQTNGSQGSQSEGSNHSAAQIQSAWAASPESLQQSTDPISGR